MSETKKYSLLIVDDENLNIFSLTHILSSEYIIYAAKCGQTAIKAAEKYIPDVILLDIIMPEMDGYSVIAELKKSEKTKNIPVIFITGLNSADDEKKGFTFGIADYITKPFSPEIVKLRVRNQIKLIEQFRTNEYDIMKYKLANDALKIALWDMDVLEAYPIGPESKIHWSQEFRGMLGFTDEKDFPNILDSWSSRLHPLDKEKTINALLAHLNDHSGQTQYDIKYRLMQKNGDYRYFHALGTTQRDNNGNPLRVASAVMDVTEKQMMEETLRRREIMLSTINRTASTMLTAEDEETFISSLKESMEIIGHGINADCVEVWQNEMRNQELHAVLKYYWFSRTGQKLKQNSPVFSFAYKVAPAQWESKLSRGEYIQGPVSELPKEDQDFLSIFKIKSVLVIPIFIKNTFWGFCCIDDCRNSRNFSKDEVNILRSACYMIANAINRRALVKEIHEAGEDKKQMSSRIEAIIGNLPGMAYSCLYNYPLYTMLFVSQGSKELIGYTPEDLVGKKNMYQAMVHPSDIDGIVKKRAETLEQGLIYEHTNRLRLEDSTIKWVWERCRVTEWSQDGTPYLIEGYVFDITHQRQLEAVEMANRAKSDFLAKMSHEIRTPMSIIIGMSDILLNSNLDTKDKNYIRDINATAKSLLAIINDILDMSKIESGKMNLNLIHYSFYTLIDEVTSMFLFLAKEKGLDFRFGNMDNIPDVLYGDDVRLRQILTNLLSNAVKYTEKGVIELTIKLLEKEKSIHFDVKDTGIGISKNAVASLFQAFEQVISEKNRNITGTGLGLIISKTFIEMMGGNIEVSSELNKGSTFSFSIPLVLGDSSQIKNKINNDNKNFISIPKANILIVDDNDFNLKVALGLFNLLDINAKTALSGREAIAQILKNDYDIVFMDHMMPELDGIETTAEIRKLGGKYKKIPIIALTANAIEGAKEMFMANDFNGYLSKPIDMNELSNILIDFLPPEYINKKLVVDNGGTSEVEDEFWNKLKKVSEIDVETGMFHFDGNKDLYRDCFKMFFGELNTLIEKIIDQINSKNIKLLAISAHTLKSSLKSIGASDLSSIAADLEIAAKNETFEYCAKLFPDFLDKLSTFHHNLSGIFPSIKIVSIKEKGDHLMLKDYIDKCIDAVESYDADHCLEMLNQLIIYDFDKTNNELLEKAIDELNRFSYDAACEVLMQIKNNIK